MRLIDADELLKRYEVRETDDGVYIHCAPVVMPTFINSLPTVDAEPVVRCKDCENFETDVFGKAFGAPIIIAHNGCSVHERFVNKDDFCCWGERKDDAE